MGEHSDETRPLSEVTTDAAGAGGADGDRAGAAGLRARSAAGLAHLPRGTVVSRYRIESALGEGGMGVVSHARRSRRARSR